MHKTRAHISLAYIHRASCLRAVLHATVVRHRHVLHHCSPLMRLPVATSHRDHAPVPFSLPGFLMSKSVISSQTTKKTLVVLSCDLFLKPVLCDYNGYTPPSRPARLLWRCLFRFGGARRPRNVRVCRHLGLVAVGGHCQGEGESPRWNSGRDEIA